MGTRHSSTNGMSPIHLQYNGHSYRYKKQLGRGANAVVFGFTEQNNPDDLIVVKLMTTPVDMSRRDRMNIVCKKCCVRATLLHDGYVEILDRMDGDLGYYVRTYNPGLMEIARIMEIVRHQLSCMDRLSAIYTDIKCENILYKRVNSSVIQVHFGDIDSIVEKPVDQTQMPHSYALPCSLNEADDDEDGLVNYLMKVFYIDIMIKHYQQNRNYHMSNVFRNLLAGKKCTTPAEWRKIENTIEHTAEYKFIQNVIHIELEGSSENSLICRHCLDVNTFSIETCPESQPCSRQNNKINYLYYRTRNNKLTRITKVGSAYTIKFKKNVEDIMISSDEAWATTDHFQN